MDICNQSHKKRSVLWNTLDANNFSFCLFDFSDFILILFSFLFDFLLDDEEVRDTAVT